MADEVKMDEVVTTTSETVKVPEVVIDEVDFNDLLELERALRGAEDQLNKLSGALFRMAKDQEVLLVHERQLNADIDAKRKDLIKRYKLDDKRQWRVDINTRKVVYQP